MPYASATDLVARFDERIIKDLASDSGTPILDVADSSVVTAALEDASGRVESALTVATIYTAADLAALTGNSQALLKRVVCELAMGYLIRRRQENMGDERLVNLGREAEKFLDRLRKGERLFSVDTVAAAGLPEIDGPSLTQYRNMNLLPERVQHFYPSRGSRLPLGRGGA